LSFRRVGGVLDVDCLAERPSITTVLAVRSFRCVGGDPVGISFPSAGCSSVVEQQQGKYISNILIVYKMRANNNDSLVIFNHDKKCSRNS
jgi:hypothetical protein